MKSNLIARLSSILTPSELLLSAEERQRFASDQSGLDGALPLAVLRPATVAALSEAVKVCAAAGVAMVPQGGRTGLSGGACATGNCVIVSTMLMSGIAEIDTDAMTMTVWAGTPLQVVQEAALEHGLEYPVDIGARGSATIGGTIATNAGGIRVLRHGMTRQHVLGLEVVLPDGQIVARLGKLVKDNAGLDLKHLFIGSEGIFGVITRAVLQLRPATPACTAALLAVRDHDAALACLSAARRTFAGRLTAFEGMWPDYWDFVCHKTELAASPLAADHGFYILAEFALEGDDSAHFENWLGQLLEEGIVEDGVIAKSLSETQALWRVREAIGDVDADFGAHINFDLGISPSQLGHFCDAGDRLLAGMAGVTGTLKVGHIGDGNVHFLVGHEDDADVSDRIERALYALVRDYGGTVTAEHGVGRLKRDWLSCCRSPEEIDLMRQLKSMLDPGQIMNPGALV
ncbi:FAD-binding oxidoreductase [uncultured Martelella sp.]|uniref:FAD-binding oxidoreductase n=1 Tax=uncultured Martelella sp. TaxID=392331 RepID=UPI0029C665D4|nr:FAD-binding oxidoreductase [uncultured Martelella sp.]